MIILPDNTFFTADTHAWHINLAYHTSEWEDRDTCCRMFMDADEMTECIIKGINDNIPPDATLVHAGDWSFGGIQNIKRFRDRINCKNIILVVGNHDYHINKNKRTDEGWRPQGIFSSVYRKVNITLKGEKFTVSHSITDSDYPIIHGHYHDQLSVLNNTFDAGVDTAYRMFGEYRPFTADEILSFFKTKTSNRV